MSMNDKAYEYYESLSKFLNNEKFYNFDLVDYNGNYPMGINKISIEVEGDWKHDHWRFKDLVNDWVTENGINLFKIDYQEVGESESDYYTAQYDIFIAPDEDTVSTLNNMSKLFRESLFEGKKISNSRRFLKESNTSKVNMIPKEFTYTLHIDNSSQDVTSYVVVIPNGLKASDGSTMDAVVYAEDENGNEINFSSIDEAQKWIDTYKDNLSFHVKNRDELHATPMKKEKYYESLDEGVNNRKVYVVEPHKIDMDLYDIVFIDNGKRASSKRFESYEDAVKFIKKNAKYNNWIAGNKADFQSKEDKLTGFGKSVKSSKINESLNEASYGGAFDIEDDQYFTRDDLDEFGYAVEEALNDKTDLPNFNYAGCWVDENWLELDMECEGYEATWKTKIDMRKIKNPRDLFRKYGAQAFDWFEKTFTEYLKESLTEDTIKTKSGKWVNKGKEGTHGKFKTKKEADAQRKAMFANGYRESLEDMS